MEPAEKFWVKLRRPPRCIAGCPPSIQRESEVAKMGSNLERLIFALERRGLRVQVQDEAVTSVNDSFFGWIADEADEFQAREDQEAVDEGPVLMSLAGHSVKRVPKPKLTGQAAVNQAVDDFFDMLPGNRGKGA